jgi:UDP-glucose 4-epimerase
MARAIAIPAALNETFNIGADEPTSLNDLAKLVAHAMGKPLNVRHLAARLEVAHAVADHSKLAKVLGYQAKWTLPAGLERMADWALRIGPRPASVFDAIELRKNLPPSWNL